MRQNQSDISKILLVIISIIAFLRFVSLGMYPLFDPTEGRYAEIGRKMFELGNWVTPFIEYDVPFWAKPPLSFWLTAISYKIFGVNEFAARLPSFLVMAATAWLIASLVNSRDKSADKSAGMISALILSSMALFFYLAGGVMTDPSLAFGVTLTMVAFWRAVVMQQKKWGYAFFAGVAIAMLAKGPIGVVLMGMPIFVWVLWHKKWKDLWQNLPWVIGTLLTVAVVLPWYMLAEMRTPGFLHYFIIGEHFERFLNKGWKGDLYGSGRAHPIFTIWAFGFVAMLPWSPLLVAAPFAANLRKSLSITNAGDKSWQLYLWLWALAPLVFFSLAKNILLTYVITSLPAFAILLAPYVGKLFKEKSGRVIVLCMAGFVAALFVGALVVVKLEPDAKWIKAEKRIVESYKEAAQGRDVPLIYVGKHTYSDEFYTAGKAKHIEDINDLPLYLVEDAYVVVTKSYKIPDDLKDKFAIVAQKNNSLLLHFIP